MLTLDEAIKHCEEKKKELKEEAHSYSDDERYSGAKADCLECAREHAQLAGWLTELQERREADRWIPVSEKLPDKNGRCIVTTDFGDVCIHLLTAFLFCISVILSLGNHYLNHIRKRQM